MTISILEGNFNTNEAAAYVGLSKSTMDKMRLTGRGAKYLKLGRRVVYRRIDLDTWLQANVHANTSDYAGPVA